MTPDCSLRFQFLNDHDGSGKLIAWANAGSYAGIGGAHFLISKLGEFALAIGSYPIPNGQAVEIAGGFWKDGAVDQEHLAIKAENQDVRGRVRIQVRMATPVFGAADSSAHQDAKIEFI